MNPELYLFIYFIIGAFIFIPVKKLLTDRSQLVLFASFFYSILFWPFIAATYPMLYFQYKMEERTRNNIKAALKEN